MPKRVPKTLRRDLQTFSCVLPTKFLAKEYKLSPKTVRRWKNRNKGCINDNPRNMITLTLREKIRIKNILKNNGSLQDAAKSINKSKSFIYSKIRRGKKFNNTIQLFPYKPIPKLRLTPTQIQQRLNYLERFPIDQPENLLEILKRKIYYDEKSFELGKVSNKQYYWSETRNCAQRFYTKDKNPAKINIFAAVSWYGKSKLRFYVQKTKFINGVNKGKDKFLHLPMDSTQTILSYQYVLKPLYTQLSNRHPTIQFECEGDNAPCHTSTICRKWIQNNNIRHTSFGGRPINEIGGKPSNSPDLSPIEYIFGTWYQKVAKQKPKTIGQFIKIIKNAWNELSLSTIRNQWNFQVRIMQWVAEHNGLQYKSLIE